MNRQEAVKQLITESGWLKKVWIRKLGISYNQLARWLGPKYVHIRVDNVEAVAQARGYSARWIDENQVELELVKLDEELQKEFELYSPTRAFAFTSPKSIRYIPVYTLDQIQKIFSIPEQDRVKIHAPETIACPPEIDDPNAYAIAIQDETMSPLLTLHMRVIVSPEKKCGPGDLAVLRTVDEEYYIGKLQFNDDNTILEREQFNSKDLVLSRSQIAFTHKIVWVRMPL